MKISDKTHHRCDICGRAVLKRYTYCVECNKIRTAPYSARLKYFADPNNFAFHSNLMWAQRKLGISEEDFYHVYDL